MRHNKSMVSSVTASPTHPSTSAGSKHFSVHPTGSSLDGTTQNIVSATRKINSAVDAQRKRLLAHPDSSDSLSTRALRSVIPAVAGMVGNKGLEAAWKKITGRDHVPKAASHDNLLLSMLFAALSAALGVLISRVATSAVSAIQHRKHH